MFAYLSINTSISVLHISKISNLYNQIFTMESTQQKHKLINPLTRYKDFVLEFPPNTYPKQVLQTSFKHPPDSGEKSYVGSGRLKGRHALVTGGDSGIGRAVVSKQLDYVHFAHPTTSIPVVFLASINILVADTGFCSRNRQGGCQSCHQLPS